MGTLLLSLLRGRKKFLLSTALGGRLCLVATGGMQLIEKLQCIAVATPACCDAIVNLHSPQTEFAMSRSKKDPELHIETSKRVCASRLPADSHGFHLPKSRAKITSVS